jgi:hypothetical protein
VDLKTSDDDDIITPLPDCTYIPLLAAVVSATLELPASLLELPPDASKLVIPSVDVTDVTPPIHPAAVDDDTVADIVG